MRARLAIVLALAATIPVLGVAGSAVAATEHLILAQEVGEEGGVGPEEEAEGQEEQGTGEEQEGQGDPEAETGAEDGAEGAAEEAGPPWTYQMARLGLLLLLGLFLGMGALYYRFVVLRARGEV